MDRFEFRPLTPIDIAEVINQPASSIIMSEEDGDIIIETPTLIATERSALRDLFTVRVMREKPGGPPKSLDVTGTSPDLLQRTGRRLARLMGRGN